MKKDTLYFISDAHLGIALKGCEDRQAHLVRFLRSIGPDAAALYIVGDLFDFWIEYAHAIRPEYFQILHELRILAESGTEIHYLAGNHDFALGSFLGTHVGVNVHTEPLETVLQGRKTYLFHGDGIIRSDTGYRILKPILRNPFNQKLFRLLHPNLGVALATFFSGSSRHFLGRRPTPAILEEYREAARVILRSGFDLVVLAHTHFAEQNIYGPKIHVNTGEWIRRRNYAMMRGGEMSLWEYAIDGSARQIAPADHDPL